MIAMVRWAACLVIAGCGRVDFDARLVDAHDDDAAMRTCSVFSMPVQLPGPVQSGADDWTPTPTVDERELYYYQFIGVNSDGEVVRATRASRSEMFSSPAPVAELNSGMTEYSVTLTDDALNLVVTRRAGATTRLYETSRMRTDLPWDPPVLLTFTGVTSTTDTSAWLTGDGLRMIFARFTGGAATADLWETTRTSRAAAWTTPVLLELPSSPEDDDEPTTSADGLELFFASARSNGVGGWDVYRATRASVDAAWSAPGLVRELSSVRDDIGMRLSSDGLTMYLNYDSVRSGGQNSQMWIATRTCE